MIRTNKPVLVCSKVVDRFKSRVRHLVLHMNWSSSDLLQPVWHLGVLRIIRFNYLVEFDSQLKEKYNVSGRFRCFFYRCRHMGQDVMTWASATQQRTLVQYSRWQHNTVQEARDNANTTANMWHETILPNRPPGETSCHRPYDTCPSPIGHGIYVLHGPISAVNLRAWRCSDLRTEI